MIVNIHKNSLFLVVEKVEDDVLNGLVRILQELKQWQPIAFLHWLIETPIVLSLYVLEENIKYIDKKLFLI